MKKVKEGKAVRYSSIREFGLAMGLSELDMELARQKLQLIKKLKAARIKKGLSQAEVASRVASKQPAIARMESGQISEVSMDFLTKVALAIGVVVTIKSAA
ncbi:MAG: helix-turn-helix transcriptional regulator [Bdellovibrionales bacterium]|nr:helix-turn-helix transcriptional regulator [Bdellovibrionales bacterium]